MVVVLGASRLRTTVRKMWWWCCVAGLLATLLSSFNAGGGGGGGGATLVMAEDIPPTPMGHTAHNLSAKGRVEGQLKAGERSVVCVNTEEAEADRQGKDDRHDRDRPYGVPHDPVQFLLGLPRLFKPLQVTVKVSEGQLSVVSASEDNLHDHFDAIVQRHLGMAPRLGDDLREKLAIRASPKGGATNFFLPSMNMATSSCPPPWSNDQDVCHLRLSPYGASCLAITSRKGKGEPTTTTLGGVQYIVKSETPFAWDLFGRFVGGVLLLFFSYALSKSKIFQFSTGIVVGALAGVIVMGIYMLRNRRDIANIIVASAASYSLALYFWVRTYFTQIVSSHWEVLTAYMASGALMGVIVVSLVRKDERTKHEARVLVRWAIRIAGLVLIFGSLASSFAQGVAGVMTVIGYFIYKVKKMLRRSNERKAAKRRESNGSSGGKGHGGDVDDSDEYYSTPPRQRKKQR